MISKLIKIDIIIVLIFSFLQGTTSAQNVDDKIEQLTSNKPLYTTFDKFYTDSIRQEIKDDYGDVYFKKIDQINNISYLDYNNDGLEDALVELSVSNSDGGTFYFLVAVLFENTENKYIYKAHFEPGNLLFKEYSQPFFLFSGTASRFSEEITTKKYKLVNNTFIE